MLTDDRIILMDQEHTRQRTEQMRHKYDKLRERFSTTHGRRTARHD
jgi:hypothetical protein